MNPLKLKHFKKSFPYVVSLCLILFAPADTPAKPSPLPQNPVTGGVEVLASEIYDVGKSIVDIPLSWLFTTVVKSKLKGFVNDLDLDDEIRNRIFNRIDDREFLDETIPFLLALKQQYTISPVDEQYYFDHHIREIYADSYQTIPGFEHSMFSWSENSSEPRTELTQSPPALTAKPKPKIVNREFIRQMVTLYDALFLQENTKSPLKSPIELDDDRLVRASSVIRNVLISISDQMGTESEIGQVLRHVAENDDRLETISISIIDAINVLLQKNFAIYQRKHQRYQELRSWLKTQLDDELDRSQNRRTRKRDIWRYLNDANDKRRFGVLTVVDGLQGHLMEALSNPNLETNVFIDQILAEHRKIEAMPAPSSSSRLAVVPATEEPQNVSFLEFIADSGYDDEHYLPFFKKLYKTYSRHGIARSGIATTPTISVRNLPIVKTGAPVAGLRSTGIPNFHFVDRHFEDEKLNRPYYFYGNDAILLDELTQKSGMQSLFQRLPRQKGMNCNAQYDQGALFSFDGFIGLIVGDKKRDFGEVLCYTELRRRVVNENKLRELRTSLLELEHSLTSTGLGWRLIRPINRKRAENLIEEIARLEDEGMPQILLQYIPWPDHFAHFTGPFSDEILSPSGELNRLDYWLEIQTKLYKEAGIYDRTLFGMAGDHGLSPVVHLLNPEIDVLDKMNEEFQASNGTQVDLFRYKKISSDEGEGPKLNNRLSPPSIRNLDLVIASTAGGNYMMDFFLNEEGLDWAKQPTWEDLKNWRTLSGQTFSPDIVTAIARRLQTSLEYLAVRTKDNCGVEFCELQLLRWNTDTQSLDHALVRREGKKVYYESPRDLLRTRELSPYRAWESGTGNRQALLKKCHDAHLDNTDTWCTEEEWQELTSTSPKPASVSQISHLYDIDRAGTINLFPRDGIGYNSKVPGRHAGESFHEKDAFVGVWGEPVKRTTRIVSAVNSSVATTLFEYLSGKKTHSGQIPLDTKLASQYIDDDWNSYGWGYPKMEINGDRKVSVTDEVAASLFFEIVPLGVKPCNELPDSEFSYYGEMRCKERNRRAIRNGKLKFVRAEEALGYKGRKSCYLRCWYERLD